MAWFMSCVCTYEKAQLFGSEGFMHRGRAETIGDRMTRYNDIAPTFFHFPACSIYSCLRCGDKRFVRVSAPSNWPR